MTPLGRCGSSGTRVSGLSDAKMATPRGVSARADLLHQRDRIADAGVFDDADVEGAFAQREVPVGQRRERDVLRAVLGRGFGDPDRIGIAHVHQPRAALEQPRRQGRDGRADEQHAPAAGDGLRVGGKNDGRLDGGLVGARHDGRAA